MCAGSSSSPRSEIVALAFGSKAFEDKTELAHGCAKSPAVAGRRQVLAACLQLKLAGVRRDELGHQIRSAWEEVVRRICRRPPSRQNVVIELGIRKKRVQTVLSDAVPGSVHARRVVERDVVSEDEPLDRNRYSGITAVRLENVAALKHRVVFDGDVCRPMRQRAEEPVTCSLFLSDPWLELVVPMA